MATLIDKLRAGADNIHSIGPERAAGLLREAADALQNRPLAILKPATEMLAPEHFGPCVGDTGERGCHEHCQAEPRCRNRAEMRAAHGTPDEFTLAIARAAPELSVAEADRAVANYRSAWKAATEPDAATQRTLNSELAAMGCDPASATQAEFKLALDRATRPRGSISVIGDPTALAVLGFEVCETPDPHAPLIGAPSLVVAEQWDAEARAAAEEPGTPGDGVGEDEDLRTQAVLDDVARHMAEHRRRTSLGLSLDGSVDAAGHPLGDVLLPIKPASVDLWPGSGLPPLMSAGTKAGIKLAPLTPEVDPMEAYDRAHESMMRDANLARMLKGKD